MQSNAPAENARERLKQVRDTVLALHKALLDSERTAYEIVHGRVASPAAFLQLLINDPSFSWLQPVTTLIVHVDETMAAKKPPATDAQLEQLIGDTRALFTAPREQTDFWKRYSGVVQRDPAVAVLRDQLEQQLAHL